MTFSEKDIQDHMWTRRDDWTSLITSANYPLLPNLVSNLTPNNIVQHLYIKKLKDIEKDLRSTKLIACELRLKKDGASTIRTDFLAAEQENTGLHIIELKKSEQTERQAFTELLGYSSHFNSIFKTFHSDDIKLVLISPMKVRIVKESMIQSLVYENKKVYALIPKFKDETDINSLYLEPWIPSVSDISSFTKNTFINNSISTMSFVWNSGATDGLEQDINLNRITYHVAKYLESINFNGFIFSQRHKSPCEIQYPNQIVIGGINPYNATSVNFIDDNPNRAIKGFDSFQNPIFYEPLLTDIIPELLTCSDNVHEDFDYLCTMKTEWLSPIVSQVKDDILSLNGNKKVTIGGVYNFNELQSSLDVRNSVQLDVSVTGLLKHIYIKYLEEKNKTMISDLVDIDNFLDFYNKLV